MCACACACDQKAGLEPSQAASPLPGSALQHYRDEASQGRDAPLVVHVRSVAIAEEGEGVREGQVRARRQEAKAETLWSARALRLSPRARELFTRAARVRSPSRNTHTWLGR